MHCFGCGLSGNFKKYLEGEIDEDSERAYTYSQALKDLEVSSSTHEHTSDVILPPMSLLELPITGVRGLSRELLETAKVYYCDKGRYRGRLIFPVYDIDGTILGFDARIFQHPDGPITPPVVPSAKYLRPTIMKTKDVLYGIHIIQSKWGTIDTVVLTEGVIDALSWIALGVPAVANFGLVKASPSKAGILMAVGTQTVVNGFDLDHAGREGWQNIKESWREFFSIGKPTEEITSMGTLGMKDANDYLCLLKNKGEI